MIDAGTPGTPSWVDLSTPDLDGATTFYRDLLGWTVEHHDAPMGRHVVGKVGDVEVGGMMTAPLEHEGLPAMWAVLFSVADVDDTVAAVTRAGGAVLEAPFDLPDARLAIVADPTGGVFGVISNPRQATPWLRTEPGAACWVELLTRDRAAAEAFYAAVFGWKAETQQHGPVLYTSFSLGGEPVAGAMVMPDEVPPDVPAVWGVSFHVADCAAAERRAVELGGTVVRSTTPTTEGRFVVLADPAGATFQLMDCVT